MDSGFDIKRTLQHVMNSFIELGEGEECEGKEHYWKIIRKIENVPMGNNVRKIISLIVFKFF